MCGRHSPSSTHTPLMQAHTHLHVEVSSAVRALGPSADCRQLNGGRGSGSGHAARAGAPAVAHSRHQTGWLHGRKHNPSAWASRGIPGWALRRRGGGQRVDCRDAAALQAGSCRMLLPVRLVSCTLGRCWRSTAGPGGTATVGSGGRGWRWRRCGLGRGRRRGRGLSCQGLSGCVRRPALRARCRPGRPLQLLCALLLLAPLADAGNGSIDDRLVRSLRWGRGEGGVQATRVPDKACNCP